MDTANELVRQFKSAQDSLVIQASDLSLGTISGMVENGAIDLSPGYQRRERWKAKKQSALIESFLLNVPVPPVYLAEEEFGTYSVIDGKQRITAIARFLNGSFALSRLERFEALDGARFADLPAELENALLVRPYVRAVTLLKQSNSDLKYEVFTRLNTGGVSLNAQEIRNVAFAGPLNELIYELSEHEVLRQQLKIRTTKSSNYTKMLDAEWVLRFLTLASSWKFFSGDLSRSMDHFMQEHRFASPEELSSLREQFSQTIDACWAVWGSACFQRPAGSGWRDQALAGMYDAQMIAISELGPSKREELSAYDVAATRAVRDLFDIDDYSTAVRSGTNTPGRIRLRVEMTKGALLDVLAAGR